MTAKKHKFTKEDRQDANYANNVCETLISIARAQNVPAEILLAALGQAFSYIASKIGLTNEEFTDTVKFLINLYARRPMDKQIRKIEKETKKTTKDLKSLEKADKKRDKACEIGKKVIMKKKKKKK